MQHASQFLNLVNAVRSEVAEITPDEVHAKLEHNPNAFLLIDVREESEWNTGHLPHAIHLSKGVIERDIERIIPDPATPMVLYCSGGYRSMLAAANLQKMGYSNVLSMAGGSKAWVIAGFELVHSP